MLNNKSNIYYINLPATKEITNQLKIGDLVYLSGTICTGRDQVHNRIKTLLDHHQEIPNEFSLVKGSAIYHMGPIIQGNSPKNYKIISGGPTTSARMEPFQSDICQSLDLRFVIGKGGMKNIRWKELFAVYLAFPGGCGAIFTKFVRKIINVLWLDLGPPEAAWFLEVQNFGPLLVSIDSQNNSLYQYK